MQIAALVISLFALVVSGFSVWYARSQSQSNKTVAMIEADRRAEEVRHAEARAEAARHAEVEVRLAPPEGNSAETLVVTNRGPANATSVSLSFVRPLSAGGIDGAFEAISRRTFELRPGRSERLRLAPDYDTAPQYEVALRWSDGAGMHETTSVINHIR